MWVKYNPFKITDWTKKYGWIRDLDDSKMALGLSHIAGRTRFKSDSPGLDSSDIRQIKRRRNHSKTLY